MTTLEDFAPERAIGPTVVVGFGPAPTRGPVRAGRRGRTRAVTIALEFVAIAVAVFLGLQADEWRDARRQQDLAKLALRQFQSEVLANKAAVELVAGYHRTLRTTVAAYRTSPSLQPLPEFLDGVQFNVFQPVRFESTARELALARQSLSIIDGELAYAITRVYRQQQSLDDRQSHFMQGTFDATALLPDRLAGRVTAIAGYLDDVVKSEASLIEEYDGLLPRIDAVLRPPS